MKVKDIIIIAVLTLCIIFLFLGVNKIIALLSCLSFLSIYGYLKVCSYKRKKSMIIIQKEFFNKDLF